MPTLLQLTAIVSGFPADNVDRLSVAGVKREVVVKIADSSLVMQTRHTLVQQSGVKESLRMRVGRSAPAPVSISSAAQQMQVGVAAADKPGSDMPADPRLQMLIQLIEKLTGRKVRIFDASQLESPNTGQAVATADSAPASTPGQAGFGLDYSKVSTYSESEQTGFQASGSIKTADGQEITFSLDLQMQSQYSATSSETLRLGDAVRQTDPLVISFSGGAGQLSDLRFGFDLNSDGSTEQINAPVSGSGFLALDKNGDGKIGNGGELFGPASGNGFAELAQYDSNGDGWIDENDPVFKQLKVWTKNAQGGDVLSGLAASGVGAISLQAASTPFDIRNAAHQLQGTVRSSSVALKDDGTVGSVQQIDLTA